MMGYEGLLFLGFFTTTLFVLQISVRLKRELMGKVLSSALVIIFGREIFFGVGDLWSHPEAGFLLLIGLVGITDLMTGIPQLAVSRFTQRTVVLYLMLLLPTSKSFEVFVFYDLLITATLFLRPSKTLIFEALARGVLLAFGGGAYAEISTSLYALLICLDLDYVFFKEESKVDEDDTLTGRLNHRLLALGVFFSMDPGAGLIVNPGFLTVVAAGSGMLLLRDCISTSASQHLRAISQVVLVMVGALFFLTKSFEVLIYTAGSGFIFLSTMMACSKLGWRLSSLSILFLAALLVSPFTPVFSWIIVAVKRDGQLIVPLGLLWGISQIWVLVWACRKPEIHTEKTIRNSDRWRAVLPALGIGAFVFIISTFITKDESWNFFRFQ